MNRLTLVIMGDETPINITAADNQWHHVAVTWSSTKGHYKAYRDGLKIVDESDFQKGEVSSFYDCF